METISFKQPDINRLQNIDTCKRYLQFCLSSILMTLLKIQAEGSLK